MDSTLSDLAGFEPIEQPEPPEHDEIDELALEVEREIKRMEARLDDIPDFPSRNRRVGGTIEIDNLINA